MKKEILFLIDGSSVLSTSFYGNLPPAYKFAKTDEERNMALPGLMKTSSGIYTNGVLTMMYKVEKILQKINPKYMAIGWDLSRNTFRREIYPLYKANRPDPPQELKSQFPIAQEVIQSMGIPSFVYERYEADDILGTLSSMFNKDVQVIILTKDQDALQLINDNVYVWYMTSNAEEMYAKRDISTKDFSIIDGVFEFTPITFEDEYGFKPVQIVDYKSLSGDKSDNVPGVSGVGDKSSIPMIQEFGDIESIYDYIENTPEKEVKSFLKELGIARSPLNYLLKQSTDDKINGKDSAFLSKNLATIKCDIDELMNLTLEDLRVEINNQGRINAYSKYEFNQLIKKYAK